MTKPRKNLADKWRDHVFLISVAGEAPALILAKGWQDLETMFLAAEKITADAPETGVDDWLAFLNEAAQWRRLTLPRLYGLVPCPHGSLYFLDCDAYDYVAWILCLGDPEGFAADRLIAVEDSNREAIANSLFSPAERAQAREDIEAEAGL